MYGGIALVFAKTIDLAFGKCVLKNGVFRFIFVS